MGDDPYDFDIALPSGGSAATGYGQSRARSVRRAGSDSDDLDASASDSDISLSEDSDGASARNKTAMVTKKPTAVNAVRGGGTVAEKMGGGASALDKAKSFLSKYSTKTPSASQAVTTSARSRRLEMSLDDEDFSLDSSGEAVQKPTVKPKPAPAESVRTIGVDRKQPSNSDNEDESFLSGEEEAFEDESAANSIQRLNEDESSGSATSGHRVEGAKPPPKPTLDAPVKPTWEPRSVPAAVKTPAMYDEDEDEVESIASQSDDDAVFDRSAVLLKRPDPALAVSESGGYDEEDFDETSTAAAVVGVAEAVVTSAAVAGKSVEEESHVHYSLDFIDEADLTSSNDHQRLEPAAKAMVEPLTVGVDVDEDDYRSTTSSSSLKDSYVEQEDSDSHDRSAGQDNAVDQTEPPPASISPRKESEEEDYSQDDRFESESIVTITAPDRTERNELKAGHELFQDDKPRQSTHVRQEQGETTVAAVQNSSNTVEEPRPRIQIVREYQQDNSASVEMRDACTQFTGNHASIQTDLTPDGMFSSTARRQSREPTPHAAEGLQAHTASLPSGPSVPFGLLSADSVHMERSAPSLPPPPPAPFASYGLYDPLQLPAATSMSIYKQQLLALQQQIHHKKLETERLFRDRIASRYSSLRGTDKFLSSNRPARLPLWEALMRVDPCLGEDKAKQIARMATDGAA